MTPDDARKLADLICYDTFPIESGMKPAAWVTVLEELDRDQAKATYRWYRVNANRAPSIRDFLAKLAELCPTSDFRPHAYEPCDECENTGWITTGPELLTRPRSWINRDGQITTIQSPPYSAAQPCQCRRGDQYRPGFDAALTHNQKARHNA